MPGPPPAFAHADEIKKRLEGMFLDYDGTLRPIVNRPEEARLSAAMKTLLSELTERCSLAIISGRDRQDVEQILGLPELNYAGSHRFEIRGPEASHTVEKARSGRAVP